VDSRANHSCERTAIKPLVPGPERRRRRSIRRSAGVAGFGPTRVVREVREAHPAQTIVAVWRDTASTDCTDLPMVPDSIRGPCRRDAGQSEVEMLGAGGFDDLPNHALERTAIKRQGEIPEPLRRRSACRSTESVSDLKIR
jgi:hypothetical protein